MLCPIEKVAARMFQKLQFFLFVGWFLTKFVAIYLEIAVAIIFNVMQSKFEVTLIQSASQVAATEYLLSIS